MTVGQGPFDLEVRPRLNVGLARQGGPDQIDRLGRQMRQVGQGLGLDLAALPIGAPQQRSLVHPILVVPTSYRHMNGTTTPSHTFILHPYP